MCSVAGQQGHPLSPFIAAAVRSSRVSGRQSPRRRKQRTDHPRGPPTARLGRDQRRRRAARRDVLLSLSTAS